MRSQRSLALRVKRRSLGRACARHESTRSTSGVRRTVCATIPTACLYLAQVLGGGRRTRQISQVFRLSRLTRPMHPTSWGRARLWGSSACRSCTTTEDLIVRTCSPVSEEHGTDPHGTSALPPSTKDFHLYMRIAAQRAETLTFTELAHPKRDNRRIAAHACTTALTRLAFPRSCKRRLLQHHAARALCLHNNRDWCVGENRDWQGRDSNPRMADLVRVSNTRHLRPLH